jgi:hypothetical protein
VKEQITRNDLRRRRAARPVGALGLLLALVLLAGGVLPAYANDIEPPPQLPHYFTGTVNTLKGTVPEGTVVEAFVEGAKRAETTVNAESRYELDVVGEVGDDGKIVTFKVAGVQANESTVWVSGELDYDFNLTIAALPTHYFAGTVSTPEGPVPEGTVVEAFVEGAKKAETTVNAESRYELDVVGEVGDDGKIVTFKVAGVQANESTAWVSGELDYDFNLTIAALPNGSPTPSLFPFECFIATAAYGTAAAEQIDVLREFREVVLLKSSTGSQFVALYYQFSPAIADLMARSDLLRTLVRELLIDPIVWTVEATGDIWRN